MTPRAVAALFEALSKDPERRASVRCSYVQVWVWGLKIRQSRRTHADAVQVHEGMGRPGEPHCAHVGVDVMQKRAWTCIAGIGAEVHRRSHIPPKVDAGADDAHRGFEKARGHGCINFRIVLSLPRSQCTHVCCFNARRYTRNRHTTCSTQCQYSWAQMDSLHRCGGVEIR